jgi:hypothetical protein
MTSGPSPPFPPPLSHGMRTNKRRCQVKSGMTLALCIDTLASQSIFDADFIEVVSVGRAAVYIPVFLNENDSILNVKNRLWGLEGIPVDQQRLIFDGRILTNSDNFPLFVNNSKVELVVIPERLVRNMIDNFKYTVINGSRTPAPCLLRNRL